MRTVVVLNLVDRSGHCSVSLKEPNKQAMNIEYEMKVLCVVQERELHRVKYVFINFLFWSL